MAKQPKEQTEDKDKAQEALKKTIKTGSHFNDIVPKKYLLSTGSLNLDVEMWGGIKPSFIKLSGESETGKTSFCFKVINNFLSDKTRKRRAIYFASDKDVSDELIARCGVPFVEDLDEFIDGKCYLIRTNIYETVCNSIKNVVEQDKETEYIFVLDSLDNFAPKAALEVDFGESSQKGGTSAISAHFCKTFDVLLPRSGHVVIFVCQYRDTINIGRTFVHKQSNSSGGRAVEHAVTWAFEFCPALNQKDDIFWKGEQGKSERLGHNCIITIKKSPNERTGQKVKYPVLYGRKDGNAVWTEKELFDQCIWFGMMKRKGAWVEWDSSVLAELQKIDPETPKQINGEDNFVQFLESKPEITKFLYNKSISLISSMNN